MSARLSMLFAACAVVLLGQKPPVEGAPESPVRVIIYEDLQCPDCAALRRMMDEQLLPRYGDKVAFEHRDFPLAKHAWARPAAIAGRHFDQVDPKLGVGWRKHVSSALRAITPANFNEKLATFAKANGADPRAAVASLQDQGLAVLVEKDYQEGVARGVSKTPTVFVDGEPFIERFTYDEIAKAIDAALAASRR